MSEQVVSADDLQKIDNLLRNRQVAVPPRMGLGNHDDFLDAVFYGMSIMRPEHSGIIKTDAC